MTPAKSIDGFARIDPAIGVRGGVRNPKIDAEPVSGRTWGRLNHLNRNHPVNKIRSLAISKATSSRSRCYAARRPTRRRRSILGSPTAGMRD